MFTYFFKTHNSFRVHAEYQLNSQPNFPFWFTPAQFWGHLIADHDCEHIHLFELSLPTDKQLNIGKIGTYKSQVKPDQID